MVLQKCRGSSAFWRRRTPDRREPCRGKYELLKRKAQEFYPESKVQYQWSAQDCMAMDQIPYIGRFSAETPDWYTATGFGKWGMSSSMAAAGMITESILGKGMMRRCLESFPRSVLPHRLLPEISAKTAYMR